MGDNKGTLSRETFKKAISADEVDDFFDTADINGDNVLEFNEFAAISCDFSAIDSSEMEKYVEELLQDLSAESARTATSSDLKQFFGAAIDEDQLHELFVRLDQTESGDVGAKEVCDFFKYKSGRNPITFKMP